MEFFKKNGFWISSFLLVAAMIGTWFYATGNLQADMDKRISAINTARTKAEGIMRVEAESGTQAHPNDQTEQGMNEKLDVLGKSVLEAWQQRYDSQQKIMQWPSQILPGVFINEFNKYHPPELLPAEEKGESVRMKNLLLLYKQQIPNQMKHICSVIQTKWMFQSELDEEAIKTEDEPEEAADEGEQDPQTNEDENDPTTKQPDTKPSAKTKKQEDNFREIVRWSENNQTLWFDKLTKFNGRDDNVFSTKLPSPSQVYMLQQDLWLLEAMFEIVRAVNAQLDGDGNPILDENGIPRLVQANDLAAVKQIDHVVFGREALSLLGSITDVDETQNSDSGFTGPGRGGRGGGSRGRSSGGSKATDLHLAYFSNPAFHGRYVNATFEPIESEKIRTIVGGDALPADDLELVVAKRVPVRLAVQMDERKIPRFLAACANSPFAFEVWQVRINRHDQEEKITLRGSEGAVEESGRGPGRGRGRGAGAPGPSDVRGSGGGVAGPRRNSKGANDVALRNNYDVGVEFYGVVKIYNPPNSTLLLGEETGGTNP